MTVNIVTGEDDLDPREIVMEGRSGEYPPMVEWGDQLPIPPQDPMIGIEDEARLAAQQFATQDLQEAEQSLEEMPQVPPTGALALPPADESMFNMFTGPQDLNRMVQEQPQNNPQWFPAQQQAAETGIPIFNRENPLFVQQPNLQQQYGATGADLARRSRFRSQRFQRTYQQAQAPQPLNTTPNTDPAVPQSTRSVFQGQYGGASVGTPPPAWNIGRELSQTWDLIRGFIVDTVTPEDGRLDSLQDLWSIALNAAPITSRPVRGLIDQASGNPEGFARANPNTMRALIPFAQSMAPAAQQDTAQPWYFDPGRGYFGEMGTGLRGAALYTIAMPGQLAAASVYSIVDLGRYLAGGQDNLPGNPNDYRSQGLRFMQAFTGQDLGFTNVRDANGNRYLAAIDPNAPVPLQFAQGAIGFIGDAIGLGWVDDALGMAASRAARAVPQRVPTPPVTPTLPPSAPVRPQATVDPETEFPMPGRPEAYEPLIVAEFTPFSQYTISLDPDLAIPERVFRNNQEITQLAENSGVIPPGTGTLTNAEVNELENLYPYGEFRRYGIRGVITGGMDEATNTLEERTARMNVRLDEMNPPAPDLRVYTGWEQRTQRRANLTVIEAIRPPRIGVVRTPPGNQAEVIDFQARLDAMRRNLPADMANGSDVAVAGAADAGEGIVSMGRAQAQLSTEMVELHEQLRAHLDELSALPVIGRNYIGDEQAIANLYDTSLRNANQPRFGQGNPNTLLSESMGISNLADSFNNAIPLAKVRELPSVAKLPTTMQDELLSALVTRGELGLEGEGDKLTISVLRRDPAYQPSTGVVLYHGSKQLDIENISPNQGGASNELGAGLYLTSNPREAEQYAKAGRTRTQSVTSSTNRDAIGRVYEVSTYNKKPLDVTQTVKPDTPINKMFKDVVRSLYGDRFARTYGTAIAGKPISEYWLAVRDVWGIANPQRPISEMKYQEFQRQISRGLQEQGYDSLVQPSRGITVVLDPETGRLPIRVQSEKPVGVGTPLEALRAQRMIDQNLHNFYRKPSTEVMALQSRVALETQALDTLVQAYEDSLRRGEDAAEFFLRAEQTLKDSSRMVRDANVVDAIEESTAAADEAVAKVDIGDDSPCL